MYLNLCRMCKLQ